MLETVSALTPEIARLAARHYRVLRASGVTIRSLADLVIGAFCLSHDHVLLHSDRDFDAMRDKIGLRVLELG